MLSFLRAVVVLLLKGDTVGPITLSLGTRLFLGLLALILGILIGVATVPGCQLLNLGELLSPSAHVNTSQPADRTNP